MRRKKLNILRHRALATVLCLTVVLSSLPIVIFAAQNGIPKEETLAANRVSTTTPLNTKFNLFDYWVYGEQTDNDWIMNSTDYTNNTTNSYKYGINKGHPLILGNGMGSYTSNNKPVYNNGLYNTTSSSWLGAYASNKNYIEDIVESRLGDDGMPHLNVPANSADLVSNGFLANKVYTAWQAAGGETSLGYLFDPKIDTEGKASYENVRNLFQLEGGNYSFHSSKNFAEFIEYTEEDRVAGSAGYFNVYNIWGVQNGNGNRGNFAPFNRANQVFYEGATSTSIKQNGISCTQNQSHYAQYYNANAKTTGTTKADTSINHYMGATMETSFIQPANGRVKNGESEVPMTFSFSGDNDVWIFIDGILVGDLGGIHSESFITLDFETGDIYRGGVEKNTGKIPSLENLRTGNVSDDLKVTKTTIKAMYEKANALNEQKWSSEHNTYADNTVHTLKFFFMERGGYDTNLSLDFNLVAVPYSSIVKVNQDGQPIEGATFELWVGDYDAETGKTTIKEGYNDNKPLCVSTTNSIGQMILVNDKKEIISAQALYTQGVDAYVLRETGTPVGYRSLDDIALYYSNGMILSRDFTDNGVYTTAKLTVTVPDNIAAMYDDTNLGVTAHDQIENFEDGIVFAVPLKFEKSDNRIFDRASGDSLHPCYGSYDDGWTVMAEGSNYRYKPEDRAAIVIAAKKMNLVAKRNSRNLLSIDITEIPGRVQTNYWFNFTMARDVLSIANPEEFNKYVADNTEYLIAFYYAPVKSLNELTETTKIQRIDDMYEAAATDTAPAFSMFEKQYSSEMHVPNTFNRFRVQKLDYRGNRIAGAKFGLFQLFSYNEREGCYPVTYLGETVYLNTSMYNFTDTQLQSIKAGAESGSYVNANTLNLTNNMKTWEQVKAGYDDGSIKPWDTAVTQATSSVKGMELEGTALFPSAFQNYQVGDTSVHINPDKTSTFLEQGYYGVYELEPPPHYIVNKNYTRVEIIDRQIFASAGEAANGIRVGMYVGWPQGSIAQFSREDAIDGTLTYVDAVMVKKSGSVVNGQWQSTITDIDEGRTTYHYKFDNALGYYQRFFKEDNTAVYFSSASNLYMFTESGRPQLEIYQVHGYEQYTLTFNHDKLNESGKVTLYLKNDGKADSTLTINLYNGRATYRLSPGQTVEKYMFAPYNEDGSLGTAYEIFENEYGNNRDFDLTQPTITDAGNKDISNLFSISTVIQFYDHDTGDIHIEKEVVSGPYKETKPFYFRLYGVVERVAEVQLFNPDGTINTTFNGKLNARIGPTLTEEQLAGGTPIEQGTSYVTIEFKNGAAKLLLPGDHFVREVDIPENPDHGAYGLTAKVKCQITLADKSYNGTLTVNATKPLTNTPVAGESVLFKDGVGYYYLARETKITTVTDSNGKEYEYTSTSRCITSVPDDIYSEVPIYKHEVEYLGVTDKVLTEKTDITLENGKYYLTGKKQGAEAMGYENADFYGGKAIVGDFALYPGQTINIKGMPGEMTLYIAEISMETKSPESLKKLKDTYVTTAEYERENPTYEPSYADVKVEEYLPDFLCYKTMIRPWVDGHLKFTNTAHFGNLEVEKTVGGSAVGMESKLSYDFKLKFSANTSDSINHLSNGVAKYTLYTGKNDKKGTEKTVTLNTNGEATITLKPNERIVFTDLPEGVNYEVVETAAHDLNGWSLADYKTTVTDENGKETKDTRKVSGQIVRDKTNTAKYLNIRDFPGYDLPESGGGGIMPFVLWGCTLITAVCFIYMRSRKRKKRQ